MTIYEKDLLNSYIIKCLMKDEVDFSDFGMMLTIKDIYRVDSENKLGEFKKKDFEELTEFFDFIEIFNYFDNVLEIGIEKHSDDMRLFYALNEFKSEENIKSLNYIKEDFSTSDNRIYKMSILYSLYDDLVDIKAFEKAFERFKNNKDRLYKLVDEDKMPKEWVITLNFDEDFVENLIKLNGGE